jgi:hypothetical protein
MLPLRDFLPQRKRLVPKIIGKQIFEFLISKTIDIQSSLILIVKRL